MLLRTWLDAIRKLTAVQIHIMLWYLDFSIKFGRYHWQTLQQVTSRGVVYGSVMLRRVES
jgi:hypothetical protein